MIRFFLTCTSQARLGFSALLIGALSFGAQSVRAQQFVVDDAGITDPGACQFEAWLGESAGWVLPACTLISRTELTLGIGYADERHGDHTDRQVEYVAQAKVNFLPDAPGGLGVSAVVGFGFGPFAQATGVPVEGLFAYVPATYILPGERAIFHANAGWSVETERNLHRLVYGFRNDVVLHERATVIGEIFGEGQDLGVQGGLRLSIIADLFLIDASYGAALSGDAPDIGFAIGIAITPPRFFTPIR